MTDIIGFSLDPNEKSKPKEYKGELEAPKKELDKILNQLIVDFQKTNECVVFIDQLTDTWRTKPIQVRLFKDLKGLTSQ